MNLKLKETLPRFGLTQSALAKELGLSSAAIAQMLNHDIWPKNRERTALRNDITALLKTNGATPADLHGLFRKVTTGCEPEIPTQEDNGMLLRKQTLLPSARKHFSLFRDPFTDDIQSAADMYVSPDIRYVREAMYQVALHGGMLAVIAESGAGKTTLLRDLEDRIMRENQPVILIRPYVLAAEDNDIKGKTLKSTHIAEAMMSAIAPLEKTKSSPEARFAQLHRALKESSAAGYSHCLVIDEAHSLPIPTIKHLKRFFELESGFRKLVSIILIGQPELKVKLSERNADVREVVQRCEMIELAPIEAESVRDYLQFKFARLDRKLDDIIEASGIDALKTRLTMTDSRSRGKPSRVSLLYPLAIGNLLTASMNLAAELGVPRVNADVVMGV